MLMAAMGISIVIAHVVGIFQWREIDKLEKSRALLWEYCKSLNDQTNLHLQLLKHQQIVLQNHEAVIKETTAAHNELVYTIFPGKRPVPKPEDVQ